MNKRVIYTEERRREIARLTAENGSISVDELSRYFGVSGTTIRLDLTALEKEGILRRTHGGAVLQEKNVITKEPLIDERTHTEEKKRIAEAAVAFIEPGGTVLIDNGTTMAAFAEALSTAAFTGLTVYSNDLQVLRILEVREDIRLQMIGGTIRSGFHYTYGQEVIQQLGRYHFRKVFLSTSAASTDGLSTVNGDLAMIKSAMITAGEEIILLADSSKFGMRDFERFASLKEITTVITDSGLSAEYRRYLEKTVSRLIIV